jgi:hypothetical protein
MEFERECESYCLPTQNKTCFTKTCYNVYCQKPQILYANRINKVNTGIIIQCSLNTMIQAVCHENVPWRCCDSFINYSIGRTLTLFLITDNTCHVNAGDILIHLRLMSIEDGLSSIKGKHSLLNLFPPSSLYFVYFFRFGLSFL